MGKYIETSKEEEAENNDFFEILKKHKILLQKHFIQQKKNQSSIPNDILESIKDIKNSFIKSNTKIEEEKKNISLKLKRMNQNNLQLLDFNCLENIFSYLPNLNHKNHKKIFRNYISFSKISKKYYEISKKIMFETTILQKKISIPFPIFKDIIKIPNDKFEDNESLILYCIENNIPKTIISTLNNLSFNFQINPFNPFKKGIGNDNLEFIKSCIAFGIDINFKYKSMCCGEVTPLLLAVEWDKLDILKYLISVGADKNCLDHFEMNCLLVATQNGQLDMVKYLLSIGFDKNCVDRYGNNCLLVAARTGELDVFKYLISIGFDKDSVNNDGWNCLLIAAGNGQLDMFKYLLSIGFDKDSVNNYGYNCLLLAVAHGELDMFKYLLSIGFDKNFTYNRERNCLLAASMHGELSMVKYLLSIGFDKNGIDNDGNNCLLLSAILEQSDTFKYLLSIGFDKNFKNSHNQSALDIAKEFNRTEIIEILQNIEESDSNQIN